MNRGRRGELVYADKRDYREFVELLRETAHGWNFLIAAYCLMPNHYHLLVQDKYSSVSRSIARMRGLISEDRKLRDRVERLIFQLGKSQEQT